MSQDDDARNEPVITGWVQTQLSGHIDTAQAHRRDGRRILGQLLVNHGVNERVAAGEPTGYFKTVKLLADGTRVTAWHNNGQNVLRIEAPHVPRELNAPEVEIPDVQPWIGPGERPPPRTVDHEDEQPEIPEPTLKKRLDEEEEEEKKDFPDTRIVGYCNSENGTIATLWLAGGDSAERAIDLSEGSSLTNTQAWDISDDGETVVGLGGDHGWLWTFSDGMVPLPAAPNARGGQAFGVSEDGRFIIGTGVFDEEHLTTRNWVYDTTSRVYEILPGGAFDGTVRISPNALWACGGDNIWNREDLDAPWRLHTKIDPPGTTSVISQKPQDGDVDGVDRTVDDTNVVTDICNDGTACGASSHWDVEIWTNDTLSFTAPHVFIPRGDSFYQQVPSTHNVFRWSPQGGMADAGPGGSPTQIAGDTEGKVFTLNEVRGIKGELLSFIDEEFGAFFAHDIYVQFFPFGRVLGAGDDELGDNTAANGISDDGEVVVGFTRDSDGNETPSMWDRDLIARQLPTIGDGTGVAISVTTKAGLLDPEDAALY